eukprot:scaffold274190_cov67-Attheya_sp.AAC.2
MGDTGDDKAAVTKMKQQQQWQWGCGSDNGGGAMAGVSRRCLVLRGIVAPFLLPGVHVQLYVHGNQYPRAPDFDFRNQSSMSGDLKNYSTSYVGCCRAATAVSMIKNRRKLHYDVRVEIP